MLDISRIHVDGHIMSKSSAADDYECKAQKTWLTQSTPMAQYVDDFAFHRHLVVFNNDAL